MRSPHGWQSQLAKLALSDVDANPKRIADALGILCHGDVNGSLYNYWPSPDAL